MTAHWLAGTRRSCTRGSSGSGADSSVTPLGSTNCTRMPPATAACVTGAVISIFTGTALWVTGAVIANFLLALVLAEDVARQDREGLVAGLVGRGIQHHLGHDVGRVLAQLDWSSSLRMTS